MLLDFPANIVIDEDMLSFDAVVICTLVLEQGTYHAFNSNSNNGISCGLNNLRKIPDGEPLDGKSRAEDNFATDDEDDFLN